MSEEQELREDETEDETEDVEAHQKATMAANDEGGGDDDSDDVEAHQRRTRSQKWTSAMSTTPLTRTRATNAASAIDDGTSFE